MTMAELDAHINKTISMSLNKTASAKSALSNIGKRMALFGGATALPVGALTYAHQSGENKPDLLQKQIDYKNSRDDFKNPAYWMGNDDDYAHPLSINNKYIKTTGSDDISYEGSVIDDFISSKGIDPKAMKVRDYKKVLDIVGDDVAYNGDIDKSFDALNAHFGK